MMPINPILAAAAADMVVGMLWYSDYAFGPLWKKATGMKNDVSKDFYLRLALQVVSSVMIATAFYIAILTFQKNEAAYSQQMFTQVYAWFFQPSVDHTQLMSAMKISGFMWLGFFVPSYLSCTVWHTNIMWQKFIIKTGSKLAQLLAMAAVLSFLH